MACEGILTEDILFDCDNPTTPGIEVNIMLINQSDIDDTLTTVDPTDKLVITNLALKAAKSAIILQGIKQINSASTELVKKDVSTDKWRHVFTGVALSLNKATKTALQEMSEGAKLVAVVETKSKGAANADAFHVLGRKMGLELNTATWSTAENDGTFQFELSSTEGYEEPTVPHTLLETDYATTKAAFDNKFASA